MCILDRGFQIKHKHKYSELKVTKAGVPQGSVVGPGLYVLYKSDVPQIEG